jgi:hypothetical protein
MTLFTIPVNMKMGQTLFALPNESVIVESLREFCITAEKWFASGEEKIFRISRN